MVFFIVLLQTLIFLQSTLHGATSGSPVCRENLPLGNEVNLTVDCHSGPSPLLEYAANDREAFLQTGKFSLDYICSSPAESEFAAERRELLRSVVSPSGTVSMTQTLAQGASCTFYGCYFTHDILNPSPQVSFALQPTSCVVDVDECVLGTHSCGDHSECVNTIGGHECYCIAGYTGNETHCTNIDECAEGEPCDVNADCVDADGSFSCSCEPGFSGDGFNCTPVVDTDMSLCDGHFGACSLNATCVPVGAGYQCVCDYGFAESGSECFNVDECLEGAHNCSESATCTDNDGSYSCECNQGYEGDGFTCTSISSGFGTVWILAAVGSGIVTVAVATILIVAVCIAKKPGRKPQLYAVNMLFRPSLWDEVDLDFNPVQPDSKFSLHSSLRSVFDKLEKTDAQTDYVERFHDNSVMNSLETHSVCTEVLSEGGGRKRSCSQCPENSDTDAAMNEGVLPLSQDRDYVADCGNIQHSRSQKLKPGLPIVPLGSEHLLNEVISANCSDAYITTADCAGMTCLSARDKSEDYKPTAFPPCVQDRNSNSYIKDAALYSTETDADLTVHRTESDSVCTSTADADSDGYIYQDDAASACSNHIWNEDFDSFSGNTASSF